MKQNYTTSKNSYGSSTDKVRELRAGLFVFLFILVSSFYAQQTYSFTPCGATGKLGPSLTQATLAYSSTNLSGSVAVVGNGIQTFTVPHSGNYRIKVAGAKGGDGRNGSVVTAGGAGAIVQAELNLTGGQVLAIVCGQIGISSTSADTGGGGGGGSFVSVNNTPLIIAGGGGSGADNNIGATSGTTTTSGLQGNVTGGVGGTNGNGGAGNGTSGGGGGYTTNGTTVAGGLAFLNGADGGPGTYGDGGFGGGGGGNDASLDNGAGGGGYSGGGGGGSNAAGGGGGSFIASTGINLASSDGLYNGSAVQNLGSFNTGQGYVTITELCSISLSVAGTNSGGAVCAGNSVTITTNAVGNYLWTTGSNLPFLIVSPATNTVYGLTATSPSNCTASSQVSITAYPVPNLNVSSNNPAVCLGNQAVLTVSGANTYSWSTNSTATNVTVTPTQSTIYSVMGTNTLGNCSSTGTIMVDVVTPSVTISGNTVICHGGTATLSANSNGAISYSWSTGLPIQTILVSPPSSTIYVVTVIVSTLNINCNALNSIQVTVNANPTVTALASPAAICAKQSATIIASGATNYTWTSTTGVPVLNSSINVASQNAAILIYTLTGVNVQGCASNITVPFIVSACLGIEEVLNGGTSFEVYPNPSNGDFTIESVKQLELVLVNELGQEVKQLQLNEKNAYKVSVSDLSNGLYFIMGAGTNKKIIVSK